MGPCASKTYLRNSPQNYIPAHNSGKLSGKKLIFGAEIARKKSPKNELKRNTL